MRGSPECRCAHTGLPASCPLPTPLSLETRSMHHCQMAFLLLPSPATCQHCTMCRRHSSAVRQQHFHTRCGSPWLTSHSTHTHVHTHTTARRASGSSGHGHSGGGVIIGYVRCLTAGALVVLVCRWFYAADESFGTRREDKSHLIHALEQKVGAEGVVHLVCTAERKLTCSALLGCGRLGPSKRPWH